MAIAGGSSLNFEDLGKWLLAIAGLIVFLILVFFVTKLSLRYVMTVDQKIEVARWPQTTAGWVYLNHGGDIPLGVFVEEGSARAWPMEPSLTTPNPDDTKSTGNKKFSSWWP